MRVNFDRIICATDFSDLSNHAIYYGVSLAKAFKAKLYLCHVIDLSSATMYGEATYAFESQLNHMEEYAGERMKRIMSEHDIEWEPLITIGNAADEVMRLSIEKDASLVITATRGRSGLKRIFMGSVTGHLMGGLRCPLLTVRGPGQDNALAENNEIRFDRILVGCDFSPDSNLALEYGLSLAQDFQSDIYLVHVLESPTYKDLPKSAMGARETIRKSLHKQMKEKLGNLVPEDAHNWCKPKTRLLGGHPHEELAKFADIHDIDLVVMGVRGQRLLESLFVGSTTERTIRNTGCSVLLVRPIEPGAE